jgi:hypothetical protein
MAPKILSRAKVVARVENKVGDMVNWQSKKVL